MNRRHMIGFGVLLVLATASWAQTTGKVSPLMKGGRTVSGTQNINDKLGNRWDIYLNYGTVQQGTNYTFSNANYLYLDGSRFRTSSSQGKLNKKGDEAQSGPFNHKGLQVYRRIKVFKKTGVARWLDIYKNPSSKAVTVSAMTRTQMNYGIASTKSNTGKGSFTKKDFACRVTTQRNNGMTVLWVPFGPGMKKRPSVTPNGNQLQCTYSIKVPPKSSVILASFIAQNKNTSTLDKMMKNFPTNSFFSDLDPQIREMIVNWEFVSEGFRIDLPRQGRSDLVRLKNNNPMFGQIKNETFPLTTMFGQAILPAKKVVGLITKPGGAGEVRVVLADGQVLSGTMDNQSLILSIASVGEQIIPITDIRHWSYRLTKEKPASLPSRQAYLMLRSGDRLQFEPSSLTLRLQTRAGGVQLLSKTLKQVQFDLPKGGIHRVLFTNGSTLGGIVEPDVLEMTTTEFGPQKIDRNLVRSIDYINKPVKVDPNWTRVVMVGGNVMSGHLVVKSFRLKTPYREEPVNIDPVNIASMLPVANKQGLVQITLWNGTILTGRPIPDVLSFQMDPGPVVRLPISQLVSLHQPNALPPDQVQTKVHKLIAQLGSETYNDREDAQKQLQRMGPTIVPLLKKHAKDKDPEVRQRIEQLLGILGEEQSSTVAPMPGPQIRNGPVDMCG
jgi:hypothetical protein